MNRYNTIVGYSISFIFLFCLEGQRKANFEECDAKIRESSEKMAGLKRDIKNLQNKYSRTMNVSIFLIFIL